MGSVYKLEEKIEEQFKEIDKIIEQIEIEQIQTQEEVKEHFARVQTILSSINND